MKHLLSDEEIKLYIDQIKPDEIYIANNHIAIDCASGYGGKVGCIRLDDFKCFYSERKDVE